MMTFGICLAEFEYLPKKYKQAVDQGTSTGPKRIGTETLFAPQSRHPTAAILTGWFSSVHAP
jgi:hypothetical protein